MRVVVHVDLVSRLGVPVGELVNVTREVVVSDDLVEGVSVGVRVVRLEPIRVLVDDGVPSNGIDVWIEFADGPDELVPGNFNVLLAVDPEQLGEVVNDEVEALLGVRAHEYAGLLEGGRGHRTLGRLVEEGPVYDRDEGELADAKGAPLAVDQGHRVLGQQAVYRGPDVRLVVRTADRLGQTQTPHYRLLARYYGPGRGRRARLHYRLVKQVPAENIK